MSFFFNDTATTEIYTLSLHDALPILAGTDLVHAHGLRAGLVAAAARRLARRAPRLVLTLHNALPERGGLVRRVLAALERSEEHTSELQSRLHLVCRLLLEKKKTIKYK